MPHTFSPLVSVLWVRPFSLQLHNSGNFLQVIILSIRLKAKITCDLLIWKPVCCSHRNVAVNITTYAQETWHTALKHKTFLLYLYRKLYLYPWSPPNSTAPSFHQVQKQYFPFFPPFKGSMRLLPARVNTQWFWVCFLPCLAWLTLLFATEAALFPLPSHSSSSHSPNESNTFRAGFAPQSLPPAPPG